LGFDGSEQAGLRPCLGELAGAPLIAGTLIVSLGGYGPAATIVGLF